MDSRAVIWAGCILIFVAGVLWNKLPSFMTFDGLKNTVEILSFFATIMVAIMAAISLKTWREQWNYNSTQDALRRLHNSLDDLVYVKIYIKAYAWKLQAIRTQPNTADAKQKADMEEQAHLDLKQAVKDFGSALQDVHLHVPNYPFVDFLVSSQRLHKSIIDITNTISDSYQNVDTPPESIITYAEIAGTALIGDIMAARDQVFELRKQTLAAR